MRNFQYHGQLQACFSRPTISSGKKAEKEAALYRALCSHQSVRDVWIAAYTNSTVFLSDALPVFYFWLSWPCSPLLQYISFFGQAKYENGNSIRRERENTSPGLSATLKTKLNYCGKCERGYGKVNEILFFIATKSRAFRAGGKKFNTQKYIIQYIKKAVILKCAENWDLRFPPSAYNIRCFKRTSENR